jgi:response regulator NasT
LTTALGTAGTSLLDDGATWIATLEGDHDIATSALLEGLTRSITRQCRLVVVDLSAASFIDASVISWLMRTTRLGSASGRYTVSVVVGTPAGAVRRLLDVICLPDLVPCFPTTAAAVAASREAQAASAPPRRSATGVAEPSGAAIPRMIVATSRRLRILVADERRENLEALSGIVTRLGHLLTATETNISAVAALTEAEPPDVAVVVVGENTERALDLIGSIVRDATCPVIAVLDVEDAAFVRKAAKCGVFAYIVTGDAGYAQLESSIDVVLYRFAEYHDLEGAFGRRAVTERAKGVLMERHAIGEEAAFLMLRGHSRRGNRKLIDVAQAVLDARGLLPDRSDSQAS